MAASVDINKRRAEVGLQVLTETETRACLSKDINDYTELVYLRRPLSLVPVEIMYYAADAFSERELNLFERPDAFTSPTISSLEVDDLIQALSRGFEVCVVTMAGDDVYYRVVGQHCVRLLVNSDSVCGKYWRPENRLPAPYYQR